MSCSWSPELPDYEWVTPIPVGPIIINLSTPLKDRAGDDVQQIQFSFGANF